MTSPQPNTVDRYREVAALLKDQHDVVLHNGEWLEQKGWQVLTFGSSTVGIIAVLQALLAQRAGVGTAFWIGLIVVLALYALMAAMAFKTIKPCAYELMPTLPGKPKSVDEWSAMYLTSDDEQFLLQLISNYAGDGGTSTGTIQDNETVNQRKARYLTYAGMALIATMLGFVGLAAVAVLT